MEAQLITNVKKENYAPKLKTGLDKLRIDLI